MTRRLKGGASLLLAVMGLIVAISGCGDGRDSTRSRQTAPIAPEAPETSPENLPPDFPQDFPAPKDAEIDSSLPSTFRMVSEAPNPKQLTASFYQNLQTRGYVLLPQPGARILASVPFAHKSVEGAIRYVGIIPNSAPKRVWWQISYKKLLPQRSVFPEALPPGFPKGFPVPVGAKAAVASTGTALRLPIGTPQIPGAHDEGADVVSGGPGNVIFIASDRQRGTLRSTLIKRLEAANFEVGAAQRDNQIITYKGGGAAGEITIVIPPQPFLPYLVVSYEPVA